MSVSKADMTKAELEREELMIYWWVNDDFVETRGSTGGEEVPGVCSDEQRTPLKALNILHWV